MCLSYNVSPIYFMSIVVEGVAAFAVVDDMDKLYEYGLIVYL